MENKTVMVDVLKDFYEAISLIDLIYLIITIMSVIKCYSKGFILSLLSASKWLLAYVVTLILFPRIKPYFKNIIDSEYVLDVTLGVVIFILVIFIILIANRAISKTIKFVGLGRLDSIFGLFFGFISSYIICVCLFTAIDIVYNYNKWPINIDKSYTFPYIEKGSNYLVKEFPNEKSYQNSKEKIEDI
ncbi:CvpA family protein [Candidatus Pelagibacter sp.]|nr:CvpA family protein [Candidatus Pelagibacter sp.]